MRHKILLGFVNTYAVWYRPYDNIMYCGPLNLFITGVFNLQTAINKCKMFNGFKYNDSVESEAN